MAPSHTELSASDFATQNFDYVIIGGGTAGLVVAARLTENPNITVGVIEAGIDRSDDLLVRVPLLHPGLYGKPEYDWMYTTTPQGKHKQVHAWTRGKLLGGTSSINISMLAKPSKGCIDSWAELGNPGWDWDSMLPYYRKFMTLNPPPSNTAEVLDTARMEKWIADGNGPIQASWPPVEYANMPQLIGREMGENLGLRNPDADIGASIGYYDQALAIDMKEGRRSSSVYDYYHPNAQRKNLSLITNAMTHRIVFDDEDTDGKKVAKGVEFVCDGKKYTVSAKKEVILSAGTVASPQILELSGIGPKSILEKYGIKCLIDNPNVGENVQDHIMSGIGYEASEGTPTAEDLKKPGVMETLIGEYQKSPVGVLVNQMTSSFFAPFSYLFQDEAELRRAVDEIIPLSQTEGDSTRAKALKLHRERLLDPEACAIWFITIPGGTNFCNGSRIFDHEDPGNYLTAVVALSHPVSRGSTHIQSADIDVGPRIDPAYLSHSADVALLAKALRYIDNELVHVEPFASKLKNGPDGTKIKMPSYQSFSPEKAEEHAEKFTNSQWHIMGSCSMLPEEGGGVVDPNLRVYGTSNLRVIDASIIPMQVQANIQTSVYAVAEKGSDLIKQTW